VRLKGLSKALREMAKVPSQVSAPFAAYVTRDLKRTIGAGTDPYGNALKPNAPATESRKGHGRPLIDTRALIRSARALPKQGAGVTLVVDPQYAARAFRVRPGFPIAGMPPQWRAELARLLRKLMQGAL
jgi:hypothetical protein